MTNWWQANKDALYAEAERLGIDVTDVKRPELVRSILAAQDVVGAMNGVLPTPERDEDEGPEPVPIGDVELEFAELALCFAVMVSPTGHAETHTRTADRLDHRRARLARPAASGGHELLIVTLPESLPVAAERV